MRKRTLKQLSGMVVAIGTLASCTNGRTERCEVIQETYIHPYGLTVPRNDWQSRGQSGQVVSVLSDGVTVTRTYLDGIPHGETTYSFPYSNQIEHVETYCNNQLVKDMVYFLSGSPQLQVIYIPEGRKITQWYDNGVPQLVEEFDNQGLLLKAEYYDIDHRQDAWVDSGEGMRIERDPYGQLIARETIQKGCVASRTTYHPNGIPKEIIPLNCGIVQGVRKTFLPAGEPNTIEEWAGGMQEGLTIAYREGERYAEIPYRRGVKWGVERRYRSGNELIEEICWKDNCKHGPCVKYVAGQMITDWYFRGEPVTRGNYEILMRSPSEL